MLWLYFTLVCGFAGVTVAANFDLHRRQIDECLTSTGACSWLLGIENCSENDVVSCGCNLFNSASFAQIQDCITCEQGVNVTFANEISTLQTDCQSRASQTSSPTTFSTSTQIITVAPPPSTTSTSTRSTSSASSNAGPIAGGVVGGVVVLGAIAGVLFFCLRKRQQTAAPSYSQSQRMEPPPPIVEKEKSNSEREVDFQGTQAPIRYLQEPERPTDIRSGNVHGDY
jgi:hypothetical protein